MNPRTLLLGASLALNGIALVAVAMSPGLVRERLVSSGPAAAVESRTIVAQSSAAAIPVWNNPGPEAMPGLIARLRAAGYPPSIVRAIITTAINDRFAARERAISPPQPEPAGYWQSRTRKQPGLQAQEAMNEISQEKNRLLQELLGVEDHAANGDERARALQRRRYGDLPRETIAQLERIIADYRELANKVRDSSLGVMKPDDYSKLALLEREQQADMERLLTPAGLLEYDLRNSASAAAVRQRLGWFDATEEEYRALYAVRKAFDEQHNPPGRGVPSDHVRPGSMMEALEHDYRRVLGEARYAEYQHANQPWLTARPEELGPGADTINRIVAQLNLPATTAATVMTVHQDIHRRLNQLHADTALTPKLRFIRQQMLGQEATTKLTQALTQQGFAAYQQNGGQWIIELIRPPHY